MVADLISNDLLDSDLYNSVLDENYFNDRIYVDLLADPQMEEAVALLLGSVNLDSAYADSVLSLASSTLHLVLPPETIAAEVEGVINQFTSYLGGDTERLEPRLNLSTHLE